MLDLAILVDATVKAPDPVEAALAHVHVIEAVIEAASIKVALGALTVSGVARVILADWTELYRAIRKAIKDHDP